MMHVKKETKILTYQANKGFCSVILLSIIGAAVASVGNVKGVGALPAWSFIFSAGFMGGVIYRRNHWVAFCEIVVLGWWDLKPSFNN